VKGHLLSRAEGLGETASLTEEGYVTVAAMCSFHETEHFLVRVVDSLGLKVCNNGGLSGAVGWHTCGRAQSLAKLTADILASVSGDCAWVGTSNYCPEMDWARCGLLSDTSKDVSTILTHSSSAVKGHLLSRAEGLGETASLTEEGYVTVAAMCSFHETEHFLVRVVDSLGLKVCNNGGLSGAVGWHTCGRAQSLAKLTADILASVSGDCAWVGTSNYCPEMDWARCGLPSDTSKDVSTILTHSSSAANGRVLSRAEGLGETASLTEEGYTAVAAMCSDPETEHFLVRVVDSLGLQVCNNGGLSGAVAWHTCERAQSLAKLTADILASVSGHCAWVGTPNYCPEMDWASCGLPSDTFKDIKVDKSITSTLPQAMHCSKSISLDLGRACVLGPSHNNLGGVGPDSGVEELRYDSVGTVDGVPFDLVITALNTLVRHTSKSHHDHGYSGCHGLFGMISIKAGTSAILRFAFEDAVTHAPLTVPNFLFSVFDLDGQVEELEVIGYSSYTLRQPVSNVVTSTPGVFRACHTSRNCAYHRKNVYPCRFNTRTCPAAWPDPVDPQALNELQKAGSVTFEFTHPTKSFTLRWGKHGRKKRLAERMLFSGSSNLMQTCT